MIDTDIKLTEDLKRDAEARARVLGLSLKDYILFLLYREALNA